MRTPTAAPAPRAVMATEAATAGETKRPTRKAAPAKPTKAAKPNGKVKAAPAKAAKGKRAARNVDPSKLDQFGFRKGSIKSNAAAMYASKSGATLGEVKEKLDSTQFNLLTEVKEMKGFKVETKHRMVPATARSAGISSDRRSEAGREPPNPPSAKSRAVTDSQPPGTPVTAHPLPSLR